MNYIETESKAMMHTYGRFPAVICRGKGAKVYDTDNKEYIDFTSGIGVSSLGYGDSELTEAVAKQAKDLMHISNLYYNPTQIEAAEKITRLTGYSKVFFANSGAEANEGAIKVARKYSFDKYGSGRSTVITLVNSFHGRTVTTLAATGQDNFHQFFYPFTEGFEYVSANSIESLKSAMTGDVCAIMFECIQGEGGVLPLDKDFVSAMAEEAAKHDILLICDEVQTGIGRTGTLLASEQFGIKPDIVTLAKGLGGGLPIGAVLVTEKCENVLSAGTHGSTFGGNPVACAAVNTVLERIPDMLPAICNKGDYFREKLSALPKFKELRGMGMMIGVDFDGVDSKEFVAKCVERGLLLLTAKASVRLLPPLVITYDEIDRGIMIMESVLNEMGKEDNDE